MGRSLIYCRVSSKEQAMSASSLPCQVRDCQAFATLNRLALRPETNTDCPGVFVDPGVSAYKIPLFDRPGFRAMWATLKPGDGIIVLCMDRMFRSTLDFLRSWETFSKAGINIHFVSGDIDMSTAAGRLAASTIAAFAQFKSDLISERISEGLRRRRQRLGLEKKSGGPKKKKAKVQVVNPKMAKATPNPSPRPSKYDAPIKKGRIWSYMRVSTVSQTIESQRETIDRLRAIYADKGYKDTGAMEIEQGVSAWSVNWRDRPVGKAIFEKCQEGDVILVSRMDRMFRSFHDMCMTLKELDTRGVIFRAGDDVDTSTLGGKLICAMVGIMAEWESSELSRKMKQVDTYLRSVRGAYITHVHLPVWLKPRWVDDETWTLELKVSGLMEVLIANSVHPMAGSLRKTAAYIEEYSALRDGRPKLPPWGCDPRVRCRQLRKRGEFEQAKALRKFAQRRGLTKKGGMVLPVWDQKTVLETLIDLNSTVLRGYIEHNDVDLESLIDLQFQQPSHMRVRHYRSVIVLPEWYQQRKASHANSDRVHDSEALCSSIGD